MAEYDTAAATQDAWAAAEANSASTQTPDAAPDPWAANASAGGGANASSDANANANGADAAGGNDAASAANADMPPLPGGPIMPPYQTGADASAAGTPYAPNIPTTPPVTVPPQVPDAPVGPRATPGPDLNTPIPGVAPNTPGAAPSTWYGKAAAGVKDFATGNTQVGDYKGGGTIPTSTTTNRDPTNTAGQNAANDTARANQGSTAPTPPEWWKGRF